LFKQDQNSSTLFANNFITIDGRVSKHEAVDAKSTGIIQQDRPQKARQHQTFRGSETNKASLQPDSPERGSNLESNL
jgi:hypothetical protein